MQASLPEYNGVVDLASLGHNYSMLFGNIAGILTGGTVAIIGSLASKTSFDWKDLKEKITLVELSAAQSAEVTENEETLKKAFKFSLKGGGLMTLILIIAWPMPLIASNFVFDQFAYGAWVAISVVWVSVAAGFIILLPVIEARHGISQVLHGRNSGATGSSAEKAGKTTK